MARKIFASLLISMVAILCAHSLALADARKDVAIIGVGTVAIPAAIDFADVEVTGIKGHTLIIKDNDTWRGCLILPMYIPDYTIEAISKTRFEAVYVEGMLEGGGKILQSNPPRKTSLSGKKALVMSHKVVANGIVGDISLYMIEKANGVQAIGFTCADSDVKYWQPIKASILASIKE